MGRIVVENALHLFVLRHLKGIEIYDIASNELRTHRSLVSRG